MDSDKLKLNKPYIFINPPSSKRRRLIRDFDCATESKGHYLPQPYDFLLLSSRFEENEFQMVDAIADPIPADILIQHINNPKMIIVALADTNWEEDFQFVKDLRAAFKNIPLFVFGDSFIDSVALGQIRPFANGVISNPLEVNLKAVTLADPGQWIEGQGFVSDQTYNEKGLKKAKRVSIPIPKHSSFFHKDYSWPFAIHRKYTTVFTAWGCPHACSYCVVAKFPNLYRDYKSVIEEMLYLKTLGLKEIYIGDRSFGLPRENVKNLLQEMIALKLSFKWSTYFHPNQYDPELLALMKSAGCHTLIVGIETHNLAHLKQFRRNITPERMSNLITHAKKLGLQICGDFILGLPGETRADVLKTIHHSKTLGLDYASFNIATPLAGSSIRDEAKQDGRIQPGEEKHFDSFGYSKALGNGHMSSLELLELRNFAVRSFYLRPLYLFRRLTRIRSLEHLLIQVREMFHILIKAR